MSFTLVASCREALSGVVATRLIREQEAEDAKAKAYEEVSFRPSVRPKGEERGWRAGSEMSSREGRKVSYIVDLRRRMAVTQGEGQGGIVRRRG
jgi:hypothetical protein